MPVCVVFLPGESTALKGGGVTLISSIPENSMTALAAIFPDARSDMQKRYCLRLLQKALKPGVFDVAMIVALLCFWREEQDGKLQYTNEEGVGII